MKLKFNVEKLRELTQTEADQVQGASVGTTSRPDTSQGTKTSNCTIVG